MTRAGVHVGAKCPVDEWRGVRVAWSEMPLVDGRERKKCETATEQSHTAICLDAGENGF